MDKHAEQLKEYQKWVREELERSVNFWLKNGMDHEHGGVYTCLDRTGKLFSTDKSVWFQGRCAWTFSYLCHVYGKSRSGWMRPRAAWTSWSGTASTGGGQPDVLHRHRRRQAAASAAAIASPEGFYAIATPSITVLPATRPAWSGPARLRPDLEPEPGLVADPTGMAPTTIPETRSGRALANPMIYLNITSVLRRVDPEQEALYNERAAECVNEIFQYHYKPELGCTLESVAMDGTPRLDVTEDRVVNPGHDIECSWFLMEDANRKGDKKQHETAVKIFDQAINAGWDYEYGGLLYFIDCLAVPRGL